MDAVESVSVLIQSVYSTTVQVNRAQLYETSQLCETCVQADPPFIPRYNI